MSLVRDWTSRWGAMIAIAAIGCVATVAILIKERAPVPGRDVFDVPVDFTAADGVVPGLGQPVLVSGVHVGTITQARIHNGRARITLTIERKKLATVHADASAQLVPISPLKDMEVDLNPGTASSPAMSRGEVIGSQRSAVPEPLSTLLDSLDSDTRDFLASFLSATGQGLRGRGEALRRALLTLGPATAQVHAVTQALAVRRKSLARLVHNLGQVTVAASRDQELSSLVKAGDQTLSAIAGADGSLRAALHDLPSTLAQTRRTLIHTGAFAQELGPALDALSPSLRRLPTALQDVRPFARATSTALATQVRPLTRQAEPLVHDLGGASSNLGAASPDLAATVNDLRYVTNEFGYNPPGHDEGGLFWLSWFVHNWNSTFGTADAHGGIGRAMTMVNCTQLTSAVSSTATVLKAVTGVANVCPKGN